MKSLAKTTRLVYWMAGYACMFDEISVTKYPMKNDKFQNRMIRLILLSVCVVFFCLTLQLGEIMST